jgi:3-deoxy-D-arabino-heptulosonate 7-phosphate (DAHP) synthase
MFPPFSVACTHAIATPNAEAAANLKSNSQQKVKKQGKTIIIEPASPDVVYVRGVCRLTKLATTTHFATRLRVMTQKIQPTLQI